MINRILPSLLAAIRTMILSMMATRLRKAGAALRPLKRCHGNLRWILAFTVSGLLAGCGVPPQFTINAVYDEKPRSDYFDRTMLAANPGQEKQKADFLRNLIISRGDNETGRLLAIVTEAGGSCNKNSVLYSCVIVRNYTTNSCRSTECTTYRRSWRLAIDWDSGVSRFTPNLRASISMPQLTSQTPR